MVVIQCIVILFERGVEVSFVIRVFRPYIRVHIIP